MDNTHEFDEQLIDSACHSLITKLQPLEDTRLKARKRRSKFWLIVLAVLVVAGAAFYTHVILYNNSDASTYWIFGGVFALVIIIILHAIFVSKYFTTFQKGVKEQVIKSLITTLLPESKYLPDHHVSMQEYNNSLLYKTGYDRYNGKNLVEGIVDKTAIRFSELHTEYKTETRSKNGGKQTQWHTIFQGIFMVADPNKNFEGRTYILPDTSERLLGNLGKWFQKNIGDSRGQVVYMENPEFEKKFAVYATDPVEARYLITPKLQERLLSLSKHVGGAEIRVSFVSGKLYLTISRATGLFNIDSSLSLLDVKTLKYYARDLTDMMSIVHILDLNTRIWTKE